MRLFHRLWQVVLAAAIALSPALCAAQGKEASEPKPKPPDMVLLLPLQSPDFAPAAEALRAGFMKARERANRMPTVMVIATDASNEQVLAEYQSAVATGTQVVIGPMTRSGVAALAASKLQMVPTLALNYPDAQTPLPNTLYAIGLSVELEARLIARQAWAEKLRSAVTVTAATPLARRVAQAFTDAWTALGGRILAAEEFMPLTDMFALKQRFAGYQPDVVFLAADAAQARAVRPFINNQIATFATSLVHTPRSGPPDNLDLNGIRFVDMPWLVQPDHTAVMVYPRSSGLSAEQERFYALGIDAFRVASELAANRLNIDLDGVTGRLTLSGNLIEREPVPVMFRDGAAVPLEATQ